MSPPSEFPNPRGDDPWDNDAICWLLLQEGGRGWTRQNLGECLRRQPNRLRNDAVNVERATSLARRHGVRQVELPFGRRTIVRLVRTDRNAPGDYPAERLR